MDYSRKLQYAFPNQVIVFQKKINILKSQATKTNPVFPLTDECYQCQCNCLPKMDGSLNSDTYTLDP